MHSRLPRQSGALPTGSTGEMSLGEKPLPMKPYCDCCHKRAKTLFQCEDDWIGKYVCARCWEKIDGIKLKIENAERKLMANETEKNYKALVALHIKLCNVVAQTPWTGIS